MKKVLIVIVFVFLLTGCYDNVELNDMDIITGIGIDYVEDNFEVIYEILNNNASSESEVLTSYTLKGTGKTISEAFIDVGYKTDRKPYLAHLKTVIISESIIDGKLNEIVDYLIRNDFRESFYFLIAKDTTPENLLKSTSKDIPVASMYIANLIENEKYNNNLAIKETYEKIYAKLIGKNYDIIMNSITLENEKISLGNSVIFKGYDAKDTLSKLNSGLYNLVTENVNAMLFSKEYAKGNVNISILNSKSEIEVKKDKIIVNAKLEGSILENNANLNLKKETTYKELNQDFSTLIENNLKNFIEVLQKNKTDILGLSEIYYQSTRKNNNNLWQTSAIEVNVDLKINTKGYIFEVNYEK